MTKSSKTEAHYRTGNAKRKCAQCTMFVRPASCTAVAGEISPDGDCDFFERESMADSKKGKVELYLIRHGATRMNSESGGPDRIRGWLDVPLSAEGKKEAKKLADHLADSGIKKIACSSLSRACATAEAIADTTGAKVIKDGDLRPWNLGKFTGQESAVVGSQILAYAKSKPDQKIPEGESFNSFKHRAFKGLLEAIEDGVDAIVTHHRVERLIKAWEAQGEKPDGEICWQTFGKRGEKTAHAEKIKVNVGALRKAAAG